MPQINITIQRKIVFIQNEIEYYDIKGNENKENKPKTRANDI
jgi:hypothetical protein